MLVTSSRKWSVMDDIVQDGTMRQVPKSMTRLPCKNGPMTTLSLIER